MLLSYIIQLISKFAPHIYKREILIIKKGIVYYTSLRNIQNSDTVTSIFGKTFRISKSFDQSV